MILEIAKCCANCKHSKFKNNGAKFGLCKLHNWEIHSQTVCNRFDDNPIRARYARQMIVTRTYNSSEWIRERV